MNKLAKKMIILSVFVLAVNFYGDVRSVIGADAATDEATIGRDDPFAGGFGEAAPDTQQFVTSGGMEQSKPALFVRTVTLKFLNAANLKTALDKMSSSYGSISVDDNTNSLIICDTKDVFEKIITEIANADQTPKQVTIEVVIIDVQLKDDTEIGVDWDFLTTDNKDLSYRQSLLYPYRLSIVEATAENIGTASAFQNIGLGNELSIINDDIRNVVSLLQERRNVNILASPRVMVVSGQKADIKTIQEIPYQEVTQSTSGGGGAAAITSTQFKEVGVTMEVKATITDDGKILLVIKPEQSVSTGTSIGGVPVIDRRQANTTLLMDDGQVVVMGGLRRRDTQVIKFQVPILGDLPLIGFLFSDNRTIVENSELMVLLSPHIYKDEAVPAEAMARYKTLIDNAPLSNPEGTGLELSEEERKIK